METTRYEKGIELLEKMISKEIMAETIEKVKQFSPDIARLIVEFAFGDVYSRPTLDLKQKELLTITSLVTLGAESQLDFHINGALNVGLSPNEIVEVIIHCIPYVGFPRALGALQVIMKVFEKRNVKLDSHIK
ncbi:carboxymuconolactone decarboxylase family protein [Fodinisporobacter ferrooxydans]|uniref:Carboxymuconolactone decarboxylase family protein n=1 Tax=Fodinisporobacter ferrooxydans TaxID=2901836 RepID=A0ABY4CVS2_9BACL|nr:carboxymuconolactone decarboxylase family protein [Alicyclobacillaceae bacterium MYW30-H2]